MSKWTVGLDLGQSQDYSAVVAVQRVQEIPKVVMMGEELPPHKYAVRYLSRWPLGTSYPDIVDDVKKLVGTKDLDHAPLVVDQTGVGKAIVDMLDRAGLGVSIRAVTITGGHAETKIDGGGYGVPKKNLVAVLQLLFQTRRLVIAKGLPHADTLKKELAAFRVKMSTTGHESFESWRERDHDDLVLALALAVWSAERFGGGGAALTGEHALAPFVAQYPGVFPDIEKEIRSSRQRQERREREPPVPYLPPGWVRRE